MTNENAKPRPWSDEENSAIVALYFEMLDKATTGQTYIKADMIRQSQRGVFHGLVSDRMGGPLALRSKGSIEAKLMNCSAAHRDVSAESGGQAVTMDGYGYRALSNYQATLKVAMTEELKRRELQGQVA